MSAQHTPGPWKVSAYGGTINPSVVEASHYGAIAIIGGKHRSRDEKIANAALTASAPDLLALAHQYASECGECAGTRVCPDDSPCTECSDIWAVIDRAEGRV